ncbi:MAG: hypothetical protein ACLPN6_25885 [Streptosporangiaceae bacterium]|jgi:hypothetical protein
MTEISPVAGQATGNSDGPAVDANKPSMPARTREGDPPPSLLSRISKHKKFFVPVILALIGVGILPVALLVFPSDYQPPTPLTSLVSIATNAPVGSMTYEVVSKGDSRYLLTILLQASVAVTSSDNVARVEVYLPYGYKFGSCIGPVSVCAAKTVSGVSAGRERYPGTVRLWSIGFPSATNEAVLSIFVQGKDFGYSSNDVTETAAMPQVIFNHPINFPLSVIYENLAVPENYDWSSFPPSTETGTYVGWLEQLVAGEEPARVAVGVDHGAQSRDDRDTFLAGALVGVAGAALIGAVQEVIHLWTDNSDTPGDDRLRARNQPREEP